MVAGSFWESNIGAVCGTRCDGFRMAAARGNDVDGCGGGTDGAGCAVGRTSGLVDFDWRGVCRSWSFCVVVMAMINAVLNVIFCNLRQDIDSVFISIT